MAVPDFQSLLVPILRVLADGQPHKNADIREQLARQLQLTEADLAEKLPSGTQTKFANRVAWGRCTSAAPV